MSESVMRWAMSGCSCGLATTTMAALALLLVPAQYWVPRASPAPPPLAAPLAAGAAAPSWLDCTLEVPPVDLYITLALLLLGLIAYICEWVQRKLMERRITKLNQYLCSSVERLRVWDSQQEQLEATLKLVQNATSEYNLLLYLLLRQHAPLPGACAPDLAFCDKELDRPLATIGH